MTKQERVYYAIKRAFYRVVNDVNACIARHEFAELKTKYFLWYFPAKALAIVTFGRNWKDEYMLMLYQIKDEYDTMILDKLAKEEA